MRNAAAASASVLAILLLSTQCVAFAWNPSTSNLSDTYASSTDNDVYNALNAKRRFDIDTVAEYGMQAGDDSDSLAFLMKTMKLTGDYIDTSYVESSVVVQTATFYPFQRKSFYAEGRYWVFYSDGSNIVYKSSTDGTTWGSATTARAGGCTNGYQFSVCFDGTYLHYAYADGVEGNDLKYRRGDPSTSGSISWTAEQAAYAGMNKHTYYFPTICIDSTGCPWIGFYHYYKSGGTISGRADIVASTATDGTWTMRTGGDGFPHTMYFMANPLTYYYCVVIPLTSSRILALCVTDTTYNILSQLWTGSAWDSTQWALTGSDIPFLSYSWSVTSKGDEAYIATGDGACRIKFRKYTYGVGWGSVETAYTGSGTNYYPVLSVAENSDIYLFWATTTSGYYKRRIGGTWDSSWYTWITGEGSIQPNQLTCFQTSFENSNKKPCIGFTYQTSPGNYPLKFKAIIIAGFCVQDMVNLDQYEVNFTIGYGQFCVTFQASGSSAGTCKLWYVVGSTWTAGDYVTVGTIQSGTEYHDAATHVGFVLTNSTSSSDGSIKVIVSKTYMQGLGAGGKTVSGIVSLAYESGTGSPKTSGTPNDRCPASTSASYTLGVAFAVNTEYAFVDGSGQSIGTGETTIATLTTSSFASGDNFVIAIVQFESTASTNIAAGNLKLARGSTTLMSNQYAIAISSSNPHKRKWYALMALDFAPQNPTYYVKATAAATGISGEAKILAISGLNGKSAQGSSTAIGTSETTLATLSTSLPAGDNIVIAILESQNTDGSNRRYVSPLNLKRSSTTLASAEYYIFHTSSATAYGAWQVHLMPYLDSGAPASAQYSVTATSGVASVVYGRATIIAFNKGSLSATYVDGDGTTIDTLETTIKALSTSFSTGSDVAVIASEQFWNFDTSNYNSINVDLNKLQQNGAATGQTTNQYTVYFGSYSADDLGNGFGLLNRFTSTPSSPEYEVKATKTNSYTLDGEAKILALCKPPRVPEFPLGPALLLTFCFPILLIVRKWKKMG